MRGLAAADEYANQARSGGRFIRHVKLADDMESSTLRFLTDHEDIQWDKFHRFQKLSSGGKQFWTSEICPRQLGQACERCINEEWPQTQFLAWSWVYFTDHVKPGDGRVQVKIGSLVRYREQVNEPRLFRYALSHRSGLQLRANRYGTLLDRDYEWIRSGAAGSNKPSYSLEPLDPTPLDPSIAAAAATLPDLEDVMMNRVDKLGGSEDTAAEAGVGHERRAPEVVNLGDMEGAASGDLDDLPF